MDAGDLPDAVRTVARQPLPRSLAAQTTGCRVERRQDCRDWLGMVSGRPYVSSGVPNAVLPLVLPTVSLSNLATKGLATLNPGASWCLLCSPACLNAQLRAVPYALARSLSALIALRLASEVSPVRVRPGGFVRSEAP